MPRNTVVKPARDSAYSDDPLAELSRIMGLNEEARMQAEKDDFGIDLEQELLGELSSADLESDMAASSGLDAAAAPGDVVDALASEIDSAFDDSFAEEQFAEEEPFAEVEQLVSDEAVEALAEEAPVADGSPAVDAADAAFDAEEVAFDADDFAAFDAALSAELDDTARSPEMEVAAPEQVEPASAVDDRLDEELRALLAEPVDAEVAVDPAAGAEAGFAAPSDLDPAAAFEETVAGKLESAFEAEAFADNGQAFDPAAPDLPAYEAVIDPARPADAGVTELAADDAEIGFEDFEPASETYAASDAYAVDDPRAYEPDDIAGESEDRPETELAQADVSPAFEAPLLSDEAVESVQTDQPAYDETIDLEAPAEDDVEAFAAEPHEWLAAEQVDEQPLQAEQAPDADWAASDAQFPGDPGPVAAVAEQPDDAAFDDFAMDLDLEADGDDWLNEAVPTEAHAPVEATQAPVDEIEEALAGFDLPDDFAVEEPTWETAQAEEQPEPAAAAPSAPADEAEAEEDPFAALAAMAATPPIMKTFGRSNPIAVNASADRYGAPRPVAEAPQAPKPEPESYFSTPRSETVAAQPKNIYRSTFSTQAAVPAASTAAGVAASAAPQAPVAPQGFARPVRPAPEAPELETVEVAEGQVPVADDLDIPDLPSFDPEPAAAGYDEFEAEFAEAFQQIAQPAAGPAQASSPAARAAPVDADEDFEASLEADLARMDAASAAFESDAGDGFARRGADLDDDYDAARSHRAQAYEDDDYALAEGFADEAEPQERGNRRGLLIAAVVAGVALIGGVGAYALSSGGDDTPALVRADPDPVKVKPENPGGVVVPNQEGKVYQRVEGDKASAPEQETLVTSIEEPMEPAAQPAAAAAPQNDTALPGVEPMQVKSEERIVLQEESASASAGNEVVGIAPKKVRTMIVRPDGTLVPREDPAPAAPAAAPQPEVTGTTATAMGQAAEAPAAAAAPQVPQVASAAQGAGDEVSILPADSQNMTAPAAGERSAEATPADASDIVVPAPKPSRPAGQAASAPEPARQQAPAAEEAPARVASAPATPAVEQAEPVAAPAPAASTAGLWQVQIASQPTQEGAQASYQDMARRYSSVLGGKPVNIVQADIPNKGTFWRVRIPAASKSDANILCAKLKTAGGSCFVSQ